MVMRTAACQSWMIVWTCLHKQILCLEKFRTEQLCTRQSRSRFKLLSWINFLEVSAELLMLLIKQNVLHGCVPSVNRFQLDITETLTLHEKRDFRQPLTHYVDACWGQQKLFCYNRKLLETEELRCTLCVGVTPLTFSPLGAGEAFTFKGSC